jgi:hypothetical protein
MPEPTSTTATAPKVDEVQKITLQIGQSQRVFTVHGKKVRGRDIMEPVAVPEVDINDQTWLASLMQMVGVPNLIGVLVRDVIRPAAFAASEIGFTDKGFNALKYLEAFKAEFDLRRKSAGLKKSEILEQRAKFADELSELIVKATSGQWVEADKNRLLQIRLELAKLSELIAKKDRRGKAPESTPAK